MPSGVALSVGSCKVNDCVWCWLTRGCCRSGCWLAPHTDPRGGLTRELDAASAALSQDNRVAWLRWCLGLRGVLLSFKTVTPLGPSVIELMSWDTRSNLEAIVVPKTEASLPGDLGLQMLDPGNLTVAPPASASAAVKLLAWVKRLLS